MNPLEIREYAPEDYNNVKTLWLKAGLVLSHSDTEKELHRVLPLNPQLFLVAEMNNRLIGTVLGTFDGRRGYVHHLAVIPEFQKKGIGTALLDELENRYKKLNVVKIHLFIETFNAGVESYYEKKGWSRRDDLIMMSKTLRSHSDD
jgi:ribosomal protein S18 acetylase RimI-like enzyme